jgi:hypothetical protein
MKVQLGTPLWVGGRIAPEKHFTTQQPEDFRSPTPTGHRPWLRRSHG